MQEHPSLEVLVVDLERKFLEYTKPALARKYLREGKARVFSKNPFTIQLLYTKQSSSIRRKNMAIRNFTEYFKDERDVFIQNISNAQLSLEFDMGNNRVEGFTVPPTRDPINLTQHIPFIAIKNSMGFRKMISRRPPVLNLLDDDEYSAFYAKKAKSLNLFTNENLPDVEAAIDVAEDKRRRVADKTLREPVADSTPDPIHQVIERGTGPGGAKHFGEKERVSPMQIITEDEIINPRVLHLCNQVKSDIPEEERMPAKELLEALEDVPNLTLDDFEHIRSHGFYKTIKKWAKAKASELMQAQEEAEAEEVEETKED